MRLADVGRTWDALGRSDPLWAIVSAPGTQGNRWDEAAFFELGRRDVAQVFQRLSELGVEVRRERALDFGCGVGRLTQALAERFDAVTGVDIAPSMLDLARRYNRHGERCTYRLNRGRRLAGIADASVDFVLSHLTLQHLAPRHTLRYLVEFLRVLRPQGVLVFQLPAAGPTARAARRTWCERLLRSAGRPPDPPAVEMHGVPRDDVVGLLERRDATVVHVEDDGSAGPAWESYLYVVVAAGRPGN